MIFLKVGMVVTSGEQEENADGQGHTDFWDSENTLFVNLSAGAYVFTLL